jgi:RES domain
LNLESIINQFDQRVQNYDNSSDVFRVFMTTLLKDYSDAISSIDLLQGIDNQYYPYIITSKNRLVNRVQTLTEGLIDTINYSILESNVDGVAFEKFVATINKMGALNLPRPPKVSQNTTFYRLRSIKENSIILERKGLFHTPFEKRGLVSTNRYSLSGYPCLYLANSTFVAWKEISDGTGTQWYAGAKFTNTIPLSFIEIDLLPFKKRNFDDDISKYINLFTYSMLFPLLVACSIKVREHDRVNKFKSEYIIPQLLLEYVRKISTDIDGIKYRSTRINDEVSAWNYAIPPKQVSDLDYCPTLKSLFKVSEPFNFNFLEPHKIEPHLPKKKNLDFHKITLNKLQYYFEETYFAQAEHILDTKILDIDF